MSFIKDFIKAYKIVKMEKIIKKTFNGIRVNPGYIDSLWLAIFPMDYQSMSEERKELYNDMNKSFVNYFRGKYVS